MESARASQGVLFFAMEPGTESPVPDYTRPQLIREIPSHGSLVHDQGYINIEDLRLVWPFYSLPSSPVYR